jgi:signal transduction histidine kinase
MRATAARCGAVLAALAASGTVAWLVRRDRVAAVERERERIADALHDVVARRLIAVWLQATMLERRCRRGESARAVVEIRDAAADALAGVRDVLVPLRAEPRTAEAAAVRVARRPIGEAAERVAAELGALGIPVQVALDDAARTTPRVASLLALAVAEAGANVAGHAPATSGVLLRLERDRGVVRLVVENGIASGTTNRPPSSGSGLRRLGARVAAEGGRLSAGADGAVWRLRVEFPEP